ncbi:hypothetical protein niasHT_031532 [Heterodera trifolii]|uniref:Uncharacterized protein n=1 Tax=Heterodera trifolii TaxID=157864 RepID=A0ABD2HPJ8_9BILA
MSIATQKILLFLFVLGQRSGETPSKMDRVVSIELIDLHCKMLPGKLMRCRALRTLDISGDQLTELPMRNDLQNLANLALCENQQVPSSFGGQLKRMKVLKAAKKNSTVQPPAMCSRALLTNLIMCDNELKHQLQQEIPSRIGNLRRLRFLDLNVNNLHAFPPTIGGCQSLAILSLRHNHLSELSMEIGKLNQLQVLDLADNSLQYLPYTLTVLCKAKTLSALWLSFNQPPLPNMTTTVMNIKFRRRRFAEGTLRPLVDELEELDDDCGMEETTTEKPTTTTTKTPTTTTSAPQKSDEQISIFSKH